jgi:hypothetical protein
MRYGSLRSFHGGPNVLEGLSAGARYVILD